MITNAKVVAPEESENVDATGTEPEPRGKGLLEMLLEKLKGLKLKKEFDHTQEIPEEN